MEIKATGNKNLIKCFVSGGNEYKAVTLKSLQDKINVQEIINKLNPKINDQKTALEVIWCAVEK